jgi:ketopantoate reductase
MAQEPASPGRPAIGGPSSPGRPAIGGPSSPVGGGDSLVVIGAGRVGSVLLRCAAASGRPATVIGRGAPVPATDGPIAVCTRAEDLDAVLAVTPLEARADLVLLQNGLLPPWQERHGLGAVTQGVVWFAATARDGRAVPGAPTSFHGPHAASLTEVLLAGGVPARAVEDRADFAREQATKLAWNCVFGLLGELERTDVGTVAARHADTVRTLCDELAPVLTAVYDTLLDPRALERALLAYTAGIPTFVASLKELAWRNGAVQAAARHAGRPTPLHDALIAQAADPPAAHRTLP